MRECFQSASQALSSRSEVDPGRDDLSFDKLWIHRRALAFVEREVREDAGRFDLQFVRFDFAVLLHGIRQSFGEIDKVDIHNNTKIGMRLLQDNITYTIFDLIEYILQRPDDVASVFVELGEKFEAGTYKSLEHNELRLQGRPG